MNIEEEKKKLYAACISETKVEDYEIKKRARRKKWYK
jgi:hypothetical protein